MTEVGSWRARAGPAVRHGGAPPRRGDTTTAGTALRGLLYRAMLGGLACFAALLAIAVVPAMLGYEVLTVRGGSMGESLPRGSLAIARRVAADQVQLGYVIVDERSRSNPKLHRVVSIEEGGGGITVRTKGDANGSVDPGELVLADRVAVHTYTIPFMGYGADFARSPWGWTLLVLLPAFVLSALTLRDIWSGDERLGRVSAVTA